MLAYGGIRDVIFPNAGQIAAKTSTNSLTNRGNTSQGGHHFFFDDRINIARPKETYPVVPKAKRDGSGSRRHPRGQCYGLRLLLEIVWDVRTFRPPPLLSQPTIRSPELHGRTGGRRATAADNERKQRLRADG